MTKKEVVASAASILREKDIRKPVSVKKHTFFISDIDGNQAEFNIKQQDKNVIYTAEDVTAILDACIEAITEALKRGEQVTIRGFGTWKLRYRKARRTKDLVSGNDLNIDARYVPKFIFGNDLRIAARMYELMLNDKENAPKLPDPIYDEEDL